MNCIICVNLKKRKKMQISLRVLMSFMHQHKRFTPQNIPGHETVTFSEQCL